jgi:type IV secretion system protein TrbH
MRCLIALTPLIAVLSSCQMNSDTLKSSPAPHELSKAASTAMAGDIVGRLAEKIGPNAGTIYLKKADVPFGQSLAAALTKHGYTVATRLTKDDKRPGIPLTFDIEETGEQTLAQLSVRNIILARAYTITAEGAAPTSPLSVMNNGG